MASAEGVARASASAYQASKTASGSEPRVSCVTGSGRYHLARRPTRYALERALSVGDGADTNKYVAAPRPTTPVTRPTVVTTPRVLPAFAASTPACEHCLPTHSEFTVLFLFNTRTPAMAPVMRPATPTPPTT